jgi:arylsulfatase A-like enzyme
MDQNNFNIQQSLLGIGIFSLSVGLSSCSMRVPDQDYSQKPNIIYILADDLGYGDLGLYGQTRIETPNLDRLGEQGMIFTQHYTSSPVCAPARCMLLTGKHSGNAYIRANDEWPERGDVWDYLAVLADSTLEGQRPLPAGTRTVGTFLQKAGYKTGIVGKWGLGPPHTESIPTKMGFDFFYGYICQRQAHTYYPLHLYRNEHRVYLDNDTVNPRIRGLMPGEDPYDLQSYERYTLNEYTPDLMFDEITAFVNDNRDNPFFLYWATPIPHLPIQAPKEWVDYYVDKFGDEEPYLGDRGYFPHRYPRAGYAAMVSYLDDQVGKLVAQLEELGILENTLIIFTSDNGPGGGGGTNTQWFNSAQPFRSTGGRIKGSLYEGGIRVPMIAYWPGVIEPGSVSGHISAFHDVLPTFCEISGAEIPDDTDGISFLPELRGENQAPHEFLYWEYPASGGQQAVRIGNWKALRRNMHDGNEAFQLFDLSSDPGETFDVARSNPEIIRRVQEIAVREHTTSENPGFRISVLDE